MPKVIKVTINGQEVDAVEVAFSVQREEWNEYLLADGGRVRIKISPAKIFRVLDGQGKPAVDADGDPLLVVKHNSSVVASSGS